MSSDHMLRNGQAPLWKPLARAITATLLIFARPLFASPLGAQKAKTPQTAPTSKLFNAKVLLQDVKTLSADAMEGRGTGARGGIKARNYVAARFKASHLLPVAASYLQPFDIQSRRFPAGLQAANVLGMLKGRVHPEKFIVISAHYDHLGIVGGQIYNGADDNASGTCALFAIANYFNRHRPQNSLLFVAFDGEEIGLRGSQHFVSHLPANKADILLDINMDMVSHSDKGELYATGTRQFPFLKPYLETIQKQSPIHLLLGHDDPATGSEDWTMQSDQGSFYEQKIPFLYFGVEDHKDYHQPTDDFATINQKFFVGATETVLSTVELLDNKLK